MNTMLMLWSSIQEKLGRELGLHHNLHTMKKGSRLQKKCMLIRRRRNIHFTNSYH